jgi:hypothetical protein
VRWFRPPALLTQAFAPERKKVANNKGRMSKVLDGIITVILNSDAKALAIT